MVLSCLADIHDPVLLEEVLYLHNTYSQSIPDVAANYVRSLLNRQRPLVERKHQQIALSNGESAIELILSRCNYKTFTSFADICKGLNELERKRVSWNLTKMMQRSRLERIGKHRFYSFRLI